MTLFGNYKLVDPQVGSASILNGKIFKVRIDDHNQVDFIDAESGTVLRQTTPLKAMIGILNTSSNIVLNTSSGSVYHICTVDENGNFNRPQSTILGNIKRTKDAIFSMFSALNDAEDEIGNIEKEVNRVVYQNCDEEPELMDPDQILDELFPENEETNIEPVLDELPSDEEETVNIDDLPEVVLEDELKWKPIHYGDGYGPAYRVTFKEDITEEQFIRYCKFRNWDLKRIDGWAWYEDHAVVHNSLWEKMHLINPNYPCGPDKVWIYKWVRVYTD